MRLKHRSLLAFFIFILKSFSPGTYCSIVLFLNKTLFFSPRIAYYILVYKLRELRETGLRKVTVKTDIILNNTLKTVVLCNVSTMRPDGSTTGPGDLISMCIIRV